MKNLKKFCSKAAFKSLCGAKIGMDANLLRFKNAAKTVRKVGRETIPLPDNYLCKTSNFLSKLTVSKHQKIKSVIPSASWNWLVSSLWQVGVFLCVKIDEASISSQSAVDVECVSLPPCFHYSGWCIGTNVQNFRLLRNLVLNINCSCFALLSRQITASSFLYFM